MGAAQLLGAAALDSPATRRSMRRRWALVVPAALGAVGLAILAAWLRTPPRDGAATGDTNPWPLAAAGAVVLAAVTAQLVRRLRRTARVLAANPWVEVGSRLHQVPLGRGAAHAMTMLELHGAPDDGTVLAIAAGIRARPMADLAGRTWVAGDDRRFYLAAPGGTPIVRARRIRLNARAADPHDVVTPLHSRVLPGH